MTTTPDPLEALRTALATGHAADGAHEAAYVASVVLLDGRYPGQRVPLTTTKG